MIHKLYDKSISVIYENGRKISLLGLAFPLLLENIFVLLYGTANTLLLSGYSDIAVSAVGVAQQVINIAVALLNMVSKGVIILISLTLGSGNVKRAGKIAGTGSVLAISISAMLAGIMLLFSSGFMTIMNLSGEVHEKATSYFEIIAFIFPITAMVSYINNLLICNGHSKVSVASGIFSNVLNVLLSYIVLYCNVKIPLEGVCAVAVCSGIAQLCGLLFSLYFFIRRRCPYKLTFLMRDVKDILRLGTPAGMSLVSYNLSQMVTTSFIAGFGVVVTNARIYVSNIVSYTSRLSVSVGNAGGILMGRHRGAMRMDNVKKLYRQNLILAVGCNALISGVVLLLHRPLISLFTKNPAIISAATVCFALDVFAEIARAVNHVSEYALNANGDVKTPLLTSTFSAWVCNVLLSYILVLYMDMGLVGIWIAIIVDEVFKATVYLLRWKSRKWEKCHVV